MAFETKEEIEDYWLNLNDIRKIAATTTDQILEDQYIFHFTDATTFRIETRILAQIIVQLIDQGLYCLPPDSRCYGIDQKKTD